MLYSQLSYRIGTVLLLYACYKNPTLIKFLERKQNNFSPCTATWENGFPILSHHIKIHIEFLKKLNHDEEVIHVVWYKQNLHHSIHDLSIVVVFLFL